MNNKKVSFSLPTKSSSSNPNSKPKPKPSQFTDESTPNFKPNHEYVTEFDSSKTLTDAKKKTIVIPPKENEWRPFKKMKNLDLPPIQSTNGQQQPLQFEVEDSNIVPPGADAGNQMSYGLNLRQSSFGKADSGDGPNNVNTIMLKKLKSDLDRLPEDEGFEQFDEVPVEGFGAALLAGYGWHEGRGIGRNAKEDVKVIECKRRAAKEGLGFFSDGPGGKVDDGKSKKREKKGKKESSGFKIGQEVRIIGGRDIWV